MVHSFAVALDREALLRELATLGHARRWRAAARIGREFEGDPELGGLIRELAGAGGAYEGGLAVRFAAASGDAAALVALLQHPSRAVAWEAARACVLGVEDEIVLGRAILEAPTFVRRRCLRLVAWTRRTALAAQLLPEVLAYFGAGEASLVLAGCPEAMVRHHLPDIAPSAVALGALAARHPAALLEFLRQTLQGTAPWARGRVWVHFHNAVAVLAAVDGSALLELLVDLGPQGELPDAVLPHLRRWVLREPGRIHRLLLQPARRAWIRRHGVPRSVLAGVRALSIPQQAALASLVVDLPHHLAPLLARIAPGLRGEVFSRAYERFDGPCADRAVLGLLPEPIREEHVRRLRAAGGERGPFEELQLEALRPIEEARPALEAAARDPDPYVRGRALAALVEATARSRRGLGETLAFLGRLDEEREPERLRALAALAAVPPKQFLPEHVLLLEAVVDAVLVARSTTEATFAAVQQLAVRLLVLHVGDPEGELFEFAIATLHKLALRPGALRLSALRRALPARATDLLLETLLPLCEEAAERYDHAPAVALAEALGRRGFGVERLEKLLEGATEDPRDEVARRAVARWLAPRAGRDERVLSLLLRDPTTIAVPEVFAHLHERRQEWLDNHLDGKPLKGRFLPGSAVFVVDAARGFGRWLPRQQRALARILHTVAGDARLGERDRVVAIRTMGRMPACPPASFETYLDDEPEIRAAALSGLADADRTDLALPVLVRCLDDARDVAVATAFARVARFVHPVALARSIGVVLGEDLDAPVRRELVRVLGAHRCHESVGLLAEEWGRERAPASLRVLVGRALAHMLDREEAWWILEEVVQSSDRGLAEALFSVAPDEVPLPHRRRYLGLLVELAGRAELAVRRRTWGALEAWSGVALDRGGDTTAGVVVARAAAACLVALDDGPWREASAAFIASCRGGRAFAEAMGLVANLVTAASPEGATSGSRPPPGPRSERARRLLRFLGSGLLALEPGERVALEAVFSSAALALDANPTLSREAQALRVGAIDWTDPSRAASVLATLAEKVSPYDVGALAATLVGLVEPAHLELDAVGLLVAAERLAGNRQPPAALLGLALLGAVGRRYGWPEDARLTLAKYQAHESPAVRAEALREV